MKQLRLIVNSISHFAVDAACFFVLFGYIATSFSSDKIAVLFLIYNFIAFGLQFVFGYIYDVFPKIKLSTIGIMLVVFGVLFGKVRLLSLLLVALGNAAFHVGGGADTLQESSGCRESGVFVSFGAVGVYFGTCFGKTGVDAIYVIAMLLICALANFGLSFFKKKLFPTKELLRSDQSFSFCVVLLFLAIVIRSLGGSVLPKPDEINELLPFLPTLLVFSGKLCGGFFADLISAKRALVLSMGLSVILAAFFGENAYAYLASLFFFNVAMPITLYALYSLFPKNAGLAFGLSTFALLIGIIPIFLFSFERTGRAIFIALGLAATAIALIIFKNKEKKNVA